MTSHTVQDRLPSTGVVARSLRRAGLLPGNARVSGLEDGGLAGSGLVGQVRRLLVSYTGDSGASPESLVLKTPLPQMAEGEALAAVERRFYELGLAGEAAVAVPRVLHCDDGSLLMEDLGREGFVRQSDGYTRDEAVRAVQEIAKLHGYFRGRALDRNAWLRPPVDSPVATFCRRELQSWDGEWPRVLGVVPGLLSTRFDDVATMLDTEDRTVAHGDFHSQNVHMGRHGCTLIDFQFVQHASGMLDVARLLATSLTVEARRDVETEILAAYEAASGTAIDVVALRAGFLWSFAAPLALHLVAMKAQGRNWPDRLPILERCLAAADDWDALSVLT